MFSTETWHEKRFNFLLNYFEAEGRCHWDSNLSTRGSGDLRLQKKKKKSSFPVLLPKWEVLFLDEAKTKHKNTIKDQKTQQNDSSQNKRPTPKPKQNVSTDKSECKRQKKTLRILAAGLVSWTFFKVFVPASGKF